MYIFYAMYATNMESVVPPGEDTGHYHEYNAPLYYADILPDIQVTI